MTTDFDASPFPYHPLLSCQSTVHGFRSTFSDWSAEQGNAPMLAEAALAHTVQGAYRRTDLFEERRPVMDAGGEYVGA